MTFFPIVFTCDENYFQYTNVVIASLLYNRNPKFHYEINILSEDLSDYSRAKALAWTRKYKNVSVHFHNLQNLDKDHFYLNSYMSVSTYYRFYIPEIFKGYKRILYLDSDLIVDADISELHTIDFEGRLALACSSPFIKNKISNGKDPAYPLSYFTEVLKMPNPLEYFNAGVLALNLEKINEDGIGIKLFEALREIPQPKLQDQDILNSVFSRNGGIKLLPEKYNFTRTLKLTKRRILFEDLKRKVGFRKSNPWYYIYHYVGKDKPWQKQGIDSTLYNYYANKLP